MRGKLVMSSFKGTYDKQKAIEMITNETRKIVYTYGFKWKCPGTMEVPVTKETALYILSRASIPDINDLGWALEIQDYSANDMY